MNHRLGLIALLFILLAPFPAAAVEDHAVVFMYHRFGEDRYPSTNIRLVQFEAQLAWLEDNHYHVWPLSRIVSHLETGRSIPDHTVAITVDDAYHSVYREAYPRLKARGWPMTVFVSTDAIDAGHGDYMGWEQMREMGGHGVEFANHGASHDHLVRYHHDEDEETWRQRVREDVLKAERRLATELGVTTKLFAYPFGEFDTQLAALVQGLGYVGFGQQSGAVGEISDRRALPRYPMAEAFAAPAGFATKAASLPLQVEKAEPWEPKTRENPPRLELTLHAGEARLGALACFTQQGEPVQLDWLDARRVQVQASQPFVPGRARYNCTAPHRDGKRYYWYSHAWLIE